MLIREALRAGWAEIRANKVRSALSFAAVGFGVAAIVYTFAIVNEAHLKQVQAFALVGPGPLQITHENWRKDDDKSLRLSRGLTTGDADDIRRALPWINMVSPTVQTWSEIRYGSMRTWASVRGITPQWRRRNWVYEQRGRFFDADDYEKGTSVCVLIEPGGWKKGKSFRARQWANFGDSYDALITHNKLLGQELVMGTHVFTVIGILKGPPQDDDPRWFQTQYETRVLVPLKTAQRYFANAWDSDSPRDRIEQIDIDTGSLGTVPAAMIRIGSLLNVLHRGEKDYALVDLRQDILNKLAEMRRQATTILSLGIIAILAGGVGIMNVTLATVFSRVREIGVRRALGATRLDILSQFVIEGMLLGLLGGIVGVMMGLACLLFIADDGITKLAALAWWHVLAALLVSVGTSFLFSLYPAYSAAALDPAETLRSE